MRSTAWLSAVLLFLTSLGLRGQETRNPGVLLRTFQGHSKAVNNLAFSPDGNQLASVSDDASVRIWEVNTGKELRVLRGHGGSYVRGIAFSPDGKWLASAGCDQRVVLWGAADGRKARAHDVNRGGECASSVAFSPDSEWLVAAGELVPAGSDEIISIWDTAAGTIRSHEAIGGDQLSFTLNDFTFFKKEGWQCTAWF
jgi:WD40 repeat protein